MLWLDLSFAYGRPVRELQKTMTMDDIKEIMAYERIRGPISMQRGDIMNAMLCNTVAASAGAKNTKIENFMPRWNGTGGQKKMSVSDASKALKIMGLAK